ncbi:hypothetical protein ACFV0C_34770 [Streptomyces sp. NPDC059568]
MAEQITVTTEPAGHKPATAPSTSGFAPQISVHQVVTSSPRAVM